VPIRVRHREIRRGSGGAGAHRGGDGLKFAFRFIGDSPAVCSFIMTRMKIAPPGLQGGEAGLPGRVTIDGKTTNIVEHIVLQPGSEVVIETAGGGGFGAPA
jgi:N-methylhydantoinase B